MATSSRIPDQLSGWTFETITSLLRDGCFESESFDFKENLPDPRDERGKARLVEAVAAFANHGVGFLVFGVRDDKALPLSERVTGLDATADFPERFGSLARQVQPTVAWHFKNPPLRLLNDRVLHVVELRRGRGGPHCVRDGRGVLFPKRTNQGVEPMSYSEVQMMFATSQERAAKLTLIQTELRGMMKLAQNFQKQSHIIPAPLDLGVIDAMLPDVVFLLATRPAIFEDLHQIRAACRLSTKLIDLCHTEIVARQRDAAKYAQQVKPNLDHLFRDLTVVLQRALEHVDAVVAAHACLPPSPRDS